MLKMHQGTLFRILVVICAGMMIITTTPHLACHPRAASVDEVVAVAILTHPITTAMKNTTMTTTVTITMTTVVVMMIRTMGMKKCTR